METDSNSLAEVRLGDFVLTHQVGAGAMGHVWHARHVAAPVQAAIKLVDPHVASSLSARRALTREIVAMARLRHPRIVRILDFGKVSEEAATRLGDPSRARTPFVVMEFVNGVPLHRLATPRDWPTLENLLFALLEALAHAHARGVVHRDLKPGNILHVSRKGVRDIKLIDFGIATLVKDPAGSVARHAGTPGYMAPEQVARGGGLRQGPWTDLYALGCIAWELATGSPPFSGDTKVILKAHLDEELPPFEPRVPVPAEFEGWLRRLLHKDPEHRFQRAADASYQLLNMQASVRSTPASADVEAASRESAVGIVAASTWLGTMQPWETEGFTPADASDRTVEDFYGACTPPVPLTWSPEVSVPPDPVRVALGSRLVHMRAPPMIGMRTERDELWDRLREIHRDDTQRLVVVRGPQGCGKSRLLEWLSVRSHELGAAESSYVKATPDRAWAATMLESILALDPEDATELPEQVAYAASTLGISDESVLEDLVHWLSDPQELAKAPVRSLAATTQRLLASQAMRRPPLICIDDAEESQELFDIIGPLLRPADRSHFPLLVVLASRQELAIPDFSRGLATYVSPAGLRDFERSELLESFLPLDGRLQDRLLARGDGTPGFYVDTLRHMIRTGALRSEKHGYEQLDFDSIELPDDFSALWLQRLRSAMTGETGHATKGLLGTLAACGVPMSGTDLESLSPFTNATFDSLILDSLAEEGLVERAGDDRWFVRSAIGALVRSILESDRGWTELVTRLVTGHETLGWTTRAHERERLGRLLLEIDRDRDALPHLLAAAKTRADRMDGRGTTELTDLLEGAARKANAAANDETWTWISWLRSRAMSRAGRYDEALEHAERALAHATTHGLHEMITVARLRVGGALGWLDRNGEAESILTELLPDKRGPNDLRARARLELGWVYRNVGELDKARECTLAALEELTDNHNILSIAYQRLGSIMKQLGDMDGAHRAWARGAEIARAERNAVGIATCLVGMANLTRHRGDIDHAERLYAEARAQYDRAGSGEVWLVRVNLAQCMVLRGRYEDGREEISRAIGMLRRQGRDNTAGIIASVRVPCSAGVGDWSRFDADLNWTRQTMEATGTAELDAAVMCRHAAKICLEQGDEGRARRALEFALDVFVRLSHESTQETRDELARLALRNEPIRARSREE